MPNPEFTLASPPSSALPSSAVPSSALPSSLPPVCTLTMYDLPSEDPEEPGLPDEFHDLQPQLLSRTLGVLAALANQIFNASDLNLYYDPLHPLWHKRPDWFLVVGVPRLYQSRDLRESYVVWDEKVSPLLVVEFLSPGTDAEDLGRFYVPKSKPGSKRKQQTASQKSLQSTAELAGVSEAGAPKPPPKFVVYEEILKVLNYVVYDRHTQTIRYFRLVEGRYQEQVLAPSNPRLWIPELALGLGVWEGMFEGVDHHWLRWCDAEGNWCLTDTEQERSAKEQERSAKEQERSAKEQERSAKEAAEADLVVERRLRETLMERLRAMGIDPETLLDS
jgi:Uma2 family endonuclease